MSRTSRFVSAVGVAYLTQIVVTAAGLALTPFLLHRVGVHDYGLWLVALQLMTYLGLLDLGIVALLPRETAYAVGRAGGGDGRGDGGAELRALIGRTLRIVLWQMPVVAVISLGIWLLMPAEWHELRGPMSAILLSFVLMFPSRVLHGALTGLQDQSAAGWIHLVAWLLSTATMVALVLAGVGLMALAASWVVSQLIAAVAWWVRLRAKFPWAIPTGLPAVSWAEARETLSRSIHASVSQLAVALVAGTDLIIIGKLLGPAAIVPYAMTGKLIAVMANQPQTFMQVALPGLAELRASKARGQVYIATSALGQGLLTISGAVFCVVLLVNRPFVEWWVGPAQFGGTTLTVLLLVLMTLRHWNTVLSFTSFALGGERRLAYVTLVDGAATVSLALLLVRLIGPIGAPLGALFGVLVVSLPSNLRAVARDLELPVGQLVRPLASWFVRVAAIAAVCFALSRVWPPPTFVGLAAATILVVAGYAVVMTPVALRPPLGDYARPRLAPLLARYSFARAKNIHE